MIKGFGGLGLRWFNVLVVLGLGLMVQESGFWVVTKRVEKVRRRIQGCCEISHQNKHAKP